MKPLHADNAQVMTAPVAQDRSSVIELLTYATGDTSLGSFLVATSQKGVRAILLGDSPSLLVAQLHEALPTAILTPSEGGQHDLVLQVETVIECPWTPFEPWLDVGWGDFEQMVYAALTLTDSGTTVTPEGVAAMIGAHPSSARLVRELAAKSLVAVAIPFHRLQDADGTSPYYRWGEARRQAILEREHGALIWWL